MRVLHIITTINRGGAENHLMSLVEAQTGVHEVAIAYLKGDGYWRRRLESYGARVINLEMGFYGDPGPWIRLRRLLDETSPAIVHAHLPPAELYTRLALLGKGRNRLPLVISKHNDEVFFKKPGQGIVGRWVAKRAYRIIAISQAVNRYMVSQKMEDQVGKLTTIHYGIDFESYSASHSDSIGEVREAWGVKPDEYLIGTVARLVPQKALHVLLEGFALYLRTAKKSAKLVLVGTGPLEAHLKALAESLNLGERIIWAGFREDIPRVMRAIDVFALTSTYEGFGLVLLEAMAAERAIVGTRVSAIPEVVEDRKTGILVTPNNASEVADAFLQFENEERRRSFGAEGCARVKGLFSLDRMVESTEVVYRASLGQLARG